MSRHTSKLTNIYTIMLCLKHFVTQPTAHDSENYSNHTSMIYDVSQCLFVMHAWTCSLCKAGN